jgi:hypothetical protein
MRRSWDAEKIYKLSSDGDDFSSKKCKRGNGRACGGVWMSLCLVGVWSQVVGIVLVRLVGMWL